MKSHLLIFVISAAMLMATCNSCASHRRSKAIKSAEIQMKKAEENAQKEYEKAKKEHYKRQPKQTQKMMKQDKKKAKRLNRPRQHDPYACAQIGPFCYELKG